MESKDYINDKEYDTGGNGYKIAQKKAREERKGAWNPKFWSVDTSNDDKTPVMTHDFSSEESGSDG